MGKVVDPKYKANVNFVTFIKEIRTLWLTKFVFRARNGSPDRDILQMARRISLCRDAFLRLQNEWVVAFSIVACSSIGLMVNKQIHSFAKKTLRFMAVVEA